jgi:hypothetical protein
MRVFFHLPRKYLPSNERQEAWKSGTLRTLEESGKIACAQCWIFQTFVALEKRSLDVALVEDLPPGGIVVTLTGFLPRSFRPGRGLIVAGVVADSLPHPRAHLHIVQNPAHARRLPHAVAMPLWTQPGLVPRQQDRGDIFESVRFFGDQRNLAPELRSNPWANALAELGLRFECVGAAGWHDYSQTDCVLAIRSFDRARHLHKPATKLHNAWLAGVPFLGGSDSAYAADGRPGNDYLRANTLDEAITHLRHLSANPALRESLAKNGTARAGAFSHDAIADRWQDLVTTTLPALARRWQNHPAKTLSTWANALAVTLDHHLRD